MACNNAEKLPTSSFSGPAGIVVGGTDFSRAFVANSGFDAVQVVNLDPQLPAIDMAMAPAHFFPLFIPTGPNPTDLAATPDGAYVFVLDTLLGAVRMIDANALTLVPVGDALDGFSVVLAPLDSVFDTMVASPSACTVAASDAPGSRCVGRVYLGSQALGQLAMVDAVAAADGTMALQSRGWVPAGGVVGRIAVTAMAGGGDRLFVTDLASNNINQIDVSATAGQLSGQVDLGDVGGAVSVSADGNFLAVARPNLQDVLVYPLEAGGLGANPTPVDLKPVFTPPPQCLVACGTPGDECAGAHPADLEMCADGNTFGYVSPAKLYPAAYLGAIPARITPVATAAAPAQVACATPGSATAYQELLAIATLDGGIYFLGLVDTSGQFNPRLLTQDNCAAPGLGRVGSSIAPSDVLAPCVAAGGDRQRTVCVTDANSKGVVTLLPGNLRLNPGTLTPGTLTMRLDWEGIVYDGSSSAGTIDKTDATHFSNYGLSFSNAVQPNDVLRLTPNSAAGNLSDACMQALGAAGITGLDAACIAERTIKAVSADGTVLTLDKPLPRICFADPDALNYVIRAGKTFLAGAVSNGLWTQYPPARVAPGQAYGMGSPQGGSTPYAAFTVQNFALDGNQTGCALYGDDGKVKSTEQSPNLARDQPLDFLLNDPYTPALWGRTLDVSAGNSTPAGRVPGGMVMAPAPYSVLLVSYSGSNGVYVMRPTQPTIASNIGNIGYVRILN